MSVVRERLKEIQDAIQDWVEFATDYEFIDDDQYTPGPTNRPYFTYSLPSAITRAGSTDSIKYNHDKSAFILSGARRITVSIKARGLPSRGSSQSLLRGTEMLMELEWSLGKPEVNAIFDRHDLTLVRVESIVDTSEVEDSVLMPRGALDLIFSFGISEEVSLDYIERIEISGQLDANQDGAFEQDIGPMTLNI